MSVEAPQISIDPYKSQVPLVQIPQQDLQGPPQQGAIYSKTGGIATLADGAMKGLLRGLQLKEERKYKTAEATMAAQDASIADANKRYNDAMVQYGEKDERTIAAWANRTKVITDAANVRKSFTMPIKETGTKSEKKAKGAKDKAEGYPVQGGFMDHLKHIASQNPQILPQIAIAGMLSQVDPKLYGQMTPEMTAQKTQMDAAQRQDVNQKVVDAATATRNKYAGRKDLTPAQQAEYDNAVAVLTPIGGSTKYQVLVDPQGQEHNVPMGTEIPAGWKVYEKPTASSTPRVGSPEEITANYLSQHKIKPEDAPPALLKYLRDYAAYRAAQTTSTSGEHMETDPTTGKLVAVKTYGSSTRGAGAPKPPAGFSPVGEDGLPQKGGEEKPSTSKGGGKITKPPAAPGAGRGSLTAAPLPPGVRDTGIKSMASTKFDVSTEESTRKSYAQIEDTYQRALRDNARNTNLTPEDRKKMDAEALGNKVAAKASLILSRAGQIEAVGGDPWKKRGQYDQAGNEYGTMDGVNWVNVKTGYAYQE